MNILHMKYAVEVAKTGSINKAASVLMIAQPNLSRSIKELEDDLGVYLFIRSPQGMILTPDGEQFINYARGILRQIEHVEDLYKNRMSLPQRLSVVVPRSTYVSEAFAQFSKDLNDEKVELIYHETNSNDAIQELLRGDCNMAIIRYASNYEPFFAKDFEARGISCELLAEFHYVLVVSETSELAEKPDIRISDLSDYIEIGHLDQYVPSLASSYVRNEEDLDSTQRHIYLYERASQFDLLAENPKTFMWVSPLTSKILERYGLVMRESSENQRLYRDVIIRKKGAKITELEKDFLDRVYESRNRYLGK